jgi:vacuolar-type H+-ATPase subunit D/Vma8
MELAEDPHLITIYMEEQEVTEMTKMKKAKKL